MSSAMSGIFALAAQAQVLSPHTLQSNQLPNSAAAGSLTSTSASSVTYSLGEGSTYTTGCFGGGGRFSCAGPLFLASSFTGTFDLRRVASPDPDFEAYAIDNVNFVAKLSSNIIIKGSGDYRVGTPNGGTVQQLTLNLQLNGGPVTVFDSGLIPGGTGGATPDFDISVNKNGLVNYDTNLHIVASATSAEAMAPQTLNDDSSIQGYLDSCACTLPTTKLSGSYALVPILETPEYSEYSVVNIHWNLATDQRAAFSRIGPITGTGNYWVFADGTEQQLTLDLVIQGERITFDTGVIEGTDFPMVDIVLENEADLPLSDELGSLPTGTVNPFFRPVSITYKWLRTIN